MGGIRINLFLILILVVFSSCYEKKKESVRLINNFNITFEDSSNYFGYKDCKVEDNKLNCFSKVSADVTYGGGVNYILPNQYSNKDIRVVVNGKVRTEKKASGYGHLLVVSLNNGKDLISWNTIEMDLYSKTTDKWSSFTDSIQIPAEKNSFKEGELKIFGFNACKHSFMEYDDLNITILEVSQ